MEINNKEDANMAVAVGLWRRVHELEAELADANDDIHGLVVGHEITLSLLRVIQADNQRLRDELESAEHFMTQIDPVHWPSRKEARERIASIRAVLDRSK